MSRILKSVTIRIVNAFFKKIEKRLELFFCEMKIFIVAKSRIQNRIGARIKWLSSIPGTVNKALLMKAEMELRALRLANLQIQVPFFFFCLHFYFASNFAAGYNLVISNGIRSPHCFFIKILF